MARILFIILAVLVLGGAGGFVWWSMQEFAAVGAINSPTDRDRAILEMLSMASMMAVGCLGTAVVGWLISFDGHRRRRPWEVLVPMLVAGAAPMGIVGRLYIYTEASGSVPVFDPMIWMMMAACAGLALLAVFLFEWINSLIWQQLALMFDAREMASMALLANRAALLFKPGQEATLRSVAIARFRHGARGDVVGVLQNLYAAGVRDDDVMEALCKHAAEQGDHDSHLAYLRELVAMHPDDETLRGILLDGLMEQRLHGEALKLLEKNGPPRDPDGMERYVSLLLTEGQLERACAVAVELGQKEGIPFRRSAALLREILSRMSEYVPALNALAAQAERMVQREQRLRWLEKSLDANPHQPAVRQQLMDIYRETSNGLRLEKLLAEEINDPSSDPGLMMELAQVQHENGKVEEARTTLGRLLSRKGVPGRAYVLLARIHFENDEFEEARRVAEQGLAVATAEKDRRDLETMLSKVEKAVLTSEVAAVLDRARTNPGDLPLQMEALGRLVQGNHVDKAIALVDQVLSHNPNSTNEVINVLLKRIRQADAPFPLLNLLSDLLANAGRFDEALDIIRTMGTRAIDPVSAIRDNTQKILRRSPHHLATLRLLGETYRDHGKFTDMIHSYSLYLANGGEETEEIDRSLANAYLALGHYDAARRFVQQLLTQDKADPELLQRIIPLALEANRPDDAADYMKRLERMDAQSVETRALKEKVEQGMGERRFAFLKRELEAGKGGGELLEQLGDVARSMSNINEAITYYQRGGRDREDNARARRCQAKLAWCYMKKRLDDLATETLRDISISMDDDPREVAIIMELLYEIGNMFLEFKLFNGAERIFKQLCKIDAGYRDVLQKVESLRG